MYNNGCLLRGHTHLIQSITAHPLDPKIKNIPPLPVEHKPISTWPEQTSYSIDYLRKSFGFRNVDTIIKEMKATAQPNFSLSTSTKEKIIDIGEVANITKSSNPKNAVPLPYKFGAVVHMDIIYGTTSAYGGIKYALFLVDRATRHKFILPMTNLKMTFYQPYKSFALTSASHLKDS